jgi:fatty-acyl-CoA synthase
MGRAGARDTGRCSGENIYPHEIEDFLHTHPMVAVVYVIGLPDAKSGETVLAWVQVREGQSATQEDIRERGLEDVARAATA